jgi:hypothetical protein
MRTQFGVTIDPDGNLFVNEGVVMFIGSTSTDVFRINSGIAMLQTSVSPIRFAVTKEQTLVAADGFAVEMTGTLTGTLAPLGWFRRINEAAWESQSGHTIEFDDTANTADLIDIDGTTVIATFSASATIAPVGSFSSTTDGENLYNGGTPFTLTSDYIGGGSVPAASVFCDIFGTQSGIYSATANFAEWESDDDPDWTLAIVAGQTELSDGTDIVADGPSLDNLNPAATLAATTYGKDTYNSGFDFSVYVGRSDVLPVEGYVWVELELSSGDVTGASGPFFGTSLPANSSTKAVVPVAYSDGAGLVEQIHQGPILWK